MSMLVTTHQQAVLLHGYTVVDGPVDAREAVEILSCFGTLVAQPDGTLANEVKASPGFAKLRHTKSPNAIQVHSEAPGWAVPPRYLALHCHVQAACGGGHTEIADVREFVADLDDAARSLMYEREIDWPSYRSDDPADVGVRRPIVERAPRGEVVRMSYNLLRAGAYAPVVDEPPSPDMLPLGARGAELADRVSEFFRLRKTSVLIPEGAILVWDNQRMLHARSAYSDLRRHLTRYWLAEHR